MLKSVLMAGALVASGLAFAGSAHALPTVDRGDLDRHCAQRYQPRGIYATADPYAEPLVGSLRCRLSWAASPGYTIENQSPEEVCARLTGTSLWQNQANRVRCGPSAAVQLNGGTAANFANIRRCIWVRTTAGWRCR